MAREAGAARHVGQAARRSRQGHRPRASTPTTSTARACSTARWCARRIRTRASSSIDLADGAEGAGREGRARVEGAGRAGDVSGRSGRRGRGRHRRARDRRGAAGPSAVRGAAALRQRRAGDGAGRAGWCFTDGNTQAGQRQETGDLDAGFKQAAHVVEATYSTHVITHVCLETHGRVCEWDGDKLTAWISTQARPRHAAAASRSGLKIPQANVRVITQYMGGGFGSKFGPTRRVSSARKLAQAGQGAGEADARSQGRASRHRQPSVGDRADQGRRVRGRQADGVRRRRAGAPAAPARRRASRCRTSISFPNRKRTHKDVYINAGQQRADARAGPSAGLLPHRNPDGRARRSRADGSGRVPHQEPAADGAERDVGATTSPRARRCSAGRSAMPTGDPTPGPIKTGIGCSAHQWGGGGRGSQAHCDITSDGSVVDEVRHAGHRHRHAHDRRDGHGRNARPAGQRREAGDRRHDLPVQRRIGGSTTAASVDAGDSHRPPARRSTRCSRRSRRTLGVDRRTLVAANGRIQVKDNPSKGLTWKDACKLLGTEPIRSTRQWEAGLSATGTSGVQFAEVDGRHRNRHRQGEARSWRSRTAA